MKSVSKLVVTLSLGMLSSVAASAMTLEQFYIASCRKDPGMPVPIEVVSPRVGPEYEGSTVRLEFTVDETGKPTNTGHDRKTDRGRGPRGSQLNQ